MASLKIIIVDDNLHFRNALRSFLENEFRFDVIDEASSGDDFMLLDTIESADLIFMDLFMPGTNGKDATIKILSRMPHLKFIAVTMHADLAYTRQLMSAGFRGAIAKPRLFADLPAAIEAVRNNLNYFPMLSNGNQIKV